MCGFFTRSKVEKFLSNPAKNYAQGSKRKICVRVADTPENVRVECVIQTPYMSLLS